MTVIADKNLSWVLASRPHGEPDDKTLALTENPIPVPQAGEMLLRTVYLSLDPYMRGRMDAGPSYAAAVEIGDVMVGGTVSRVEVSNIAGFNKGDWVLNQGGWQTYSISNGEHVTKLDDGMVQPSYALGIQGMPGFTAFMGLSEIGKPKPGETLVVAAATGPVGATVGQLGKIWGCKVVGVAGGAEKCRYAVETLGFDHCIDHTSPHFAKELSDACHQGIDIYFENVGGKVFDAVFPLLNTAARVPVCGFIASYNSTDLPDGPDRTPYIMMSLIKRRITMRGFIIFQDFGDQFGYFTKEMQKLLSENKIAYREELITGIENAPDAFRKLLKGKNFGKVVIQVTQP